MAQPGPPTMPRPGARCLSDGQLDGLMGQLAPMHDDKMRKDLLGQPPVSSPCDITFHDLVMSHARTMLSRRHHM